MALLILSSLACYVEQEENKGACGNFSRYPIGEGGHDGPVRRPIMRQL